MRRAGKTMATGLLALAAAVTVPLLSGAASAGAGPDAPMATAFGTAVHRAAGPPAHADSDVTSGDFASYYSAWSSAAYGGAQNGLLDEGLAGQGLAGPMLTGASAGTGF